MYYATKIQQFSHLSTILIQNNPKKKNKITITTKHSAKTRNQTDTSPLLKMQTREYICNVDTPSCLYLYSKTTFNQNDFTFLHHHH